MHGRKSGYRSALPLPVAASAAAQDGMHALADFDQSLPVSAAELDAIEAYLGKLISGILEVNSPALDSEAPHIPATMTKSVAGEKRHEVLVEDSA